MNWRILMSLFIISGMVILVYNSNKYFHIKLTLDAPIIFHIKKGESTLHVLNRLGERGIISCINCIKFLARIWYPNLIIRHGEYLLTSDMMIADLFLHFQQGKIVPRKFTVIEGYTVKRVKNLLMQEEALKGEITLDIEEGMLYPDTYYYTAGQKRDDLLRAMHKKMADILENLALYYKYEDKRKLLILASIVEKETQIASERPKVAAVFLNRLKYNMKLQADPTIIYDLSNGMGYMDRSLTRKDLAADSPYNSYKNYGLPPTAIAIPSMASLEAVLNPASVEDLYFVVNILGGHCFAKSLKNHNVNVRRYRSQSTQGCIEE